MLPRIHPKNTGTPTHPVTSTYPNPSKTRSLKREHKKHKSKTVIKAEMESNPSRPTTNTTTQQAHIMAPSQERVKETQSLPLKSPHVLQRVRQPPVVPQQLDHLAEPQVAGALHLHEALVRRGDLGGLLGGEGGRYVGEGLVPLASAAYDCEVGRGQGMGR